VDSLSTQFPTACPLLKKNLCCATENYQEALDSVKKFLRSIGFLDNFEFHTVNKNGFRLKAKLAVRGTYQNPSIGIFKTGTHEVIDMQSCPLHHPLINQFLHVLKEGLKTLKIAPYDEKKHQGILRYIQVLVNDQGALQVVLVLNKELECVDELIDVLKAKTPLVSLWVNYQTNVTNTIFGKDWKHLFFDKYLCYKICDANIFFHPGSFCQANLLAFEALLKDTHKQLQRGEKILDLYSGVGLFGIILRDKFKKVIFAENNPYSLESFKHICVANDLDMKNFYVQDAKEVLQKHLDADCVIVDPPRKGLHPDIKNVLQELKQGANLVYISCGYESFIRDTKQLLECGYILDFIKGYEFFPGSKEIEILSVFKKI
jgi:hypothetical protein